MTYKIDFPIDLSALPEDALNFVEAIAAELTYQAPAMLGGRLPA